MRFPEFTDEWNEFKIGEICDVVGGGTPKTDDNSYWDGDIDWYTPSELSEHKYVYESKRKITKKGLDNCSAKLLPPKTILLSSRATIGETGIILKESTTNQGFQSLIAKRNLNYQFLYYLIDTIKKELIIRASGSTFLEISKNEIKKIKVNIPLKNEQIKIAKFISLIDQKIDLLEKKLVLWDKYIFSLKCNYFDNINVEKIVKFKEIIKKGKAGGTPKSSIQSYYNGEIPFLTINDMTKQGKFIKSTEKTITKEGLNNSSAWIVPKNSLLYSMYASIGLVSINKIDLTTSQAIYSIILKDNVNQEYIFHYLKNYKRFIHKYIETGTQGNLNSKIIKNIKIKLPSLEEKNYYSNLFNIFDYKIQTLNTKIKQYKTFKKYLLQNMFI